jgi:hypothetical protein
MIKNPLHTEVKWKGYPLIIDVADLSGIAYGYNYEVMAMRHGGGEVESIRVETFEQAETEYNRMVKKYTEKPEEKEKPLTGKYLKLKEDLEKAVELAEIAVAGQEDNGTCNFDACSLKLPRWREKLVMQAAQEAGTGCFVWDLWGKKRYVFSLPHVGQANRRSLAADTMTDYMKRIGYDAVEYCAMD